MYFILVIGLLLYTISLSKRVKHLEDQMGSKTTAKVATQVQESAGSTAVPAYTQDTPDTQNIQTEQEIAPSNDTSTPGSGDRFIEWIKEDFLVKVGALLLIIAFGWFVSYAFANNWIGEMGRIALGLLLGVAVLAAGTFRIRTYVHQGGIFLVLGSTVILLTVWAAREIYGFFTPAIALTAMFLPVAFVGLQSFIYDSKNLAVVSLILASVAPLFTNSPSPDLGGLFAYLLLIVLGTIWIVLVRGWNILAPLSLLIVSVYSLPFATAFVKGYSDTMAIGFAFLFTAIFYVSNVVSILYTKTGNISRSHLITGFGTGLFLTGWVLNSMADNWLSITLAVWALVFAVAAFLLYRYSSRPEPFYIYGGVGVALIGIATAFELYGAALTIALTLESAFLIIASVVVALRPNVVRSLCLTLLVPGYSVFFHFERYLYRDIAFGSDFFAILVFIFALLAVAFTLRLNAKQMFDEIYTSLSTIIFVAASFLGLLLLWLVLHTVIVNYDVATTVTLLIYTLIGIGSYLYGRFNDSIYIKYVGAIIIGFVIGRLLLVEVWNMAMSGRIITFFLIGALLISTAFIRKSSKK